VLDSDVPATYMSRVTVTSRSVFDTGVA
jgi:hypothetical protein